MNTVKKMFMGLTLMVLVLSAVNNVKATSLDLLNDVTDLDKAFEINFVGYALEDVTTRWDFIFTVKDSAPKTAMFIAEEDGTFTFLSPSGTSTKLNCRLGTSCSLTGLGYLNLYSVEHYNRYTFTFDISDFIDEDGTNLLQGYTVTGGGFEPGTLRVYDEGKIEFTIWTWTDVIGGSDSYPHKPYIDFTVTGYQPPRGNVDDPIIVEPPDVHDTPEPASILLLGTGIIGLGMVARRKLGKK